MTSGEQKEGEKRAERREQKGSPHLSGIPAMRSRKRQAHSAVQVALPEGYGPAHL